MKILVKSTLMLTTVLCVTKSTTVSAASAEYSTGSQYTIGGRAEGKPISMNIPTTGNAPLARIRAALVDLKPVILRALTKAEKLGFNEADDTNGAPHYTAMPTTGDHDNGDNSVDPSTNNILSGDMANRTGINNTGIVAADVTTTGGTNIPAGTITFELKFSDIAGVGDFADGTLISYRPIISGDSATPDNILDWKCVSTISHKGFSGMKEHPDGTNLRLDPVLNGLGFPFNGCMTSIDETTNPPLAGGESA